MRAPGLLGRSVSVAVGGVEERDPGVEGGARARGRRVGLDAAGVRQPRAARDLRDLQVAGTEWTMAHGGYRRSPCRCRSAQRPTLLVFGRTGPISATGGSPGAAPCIRGV